MSRDSVFNTGPSPSDALSAGASDQPLAVPVRSNTTVTLDGRLQTLYEHMVRVSRVGKPRSKVTWRSILGAHLKPAKANGGRIPPALSPLPLLYSFYNNCAILVRKRDHPWASLDRRAAAHLRKKETGRWGFGDA